MTVPAVELEDVELGFRGTPVIERVSLRLESNDYLAILGPNGGGKTTLLKIILGILEPDRGSVRVFGAPPARARGQVGYVPQHFRFDLDFPIRVLDVVLMGRLARRGPLRRFSAEDRRIARQMLERVEILQLAEQQVGWLSGGELQRVLIARALAVEPRLLLLDEPGASLDERIGRSLWELLEDLSREMTVVLVSHDIGAISQYVRSVACLNRRLYYHPSGELTKEILEETYGCPVDLLAHGHPHRVLGSHEGPSDPSGRSGPSGPLGDGEGA
jgi:zinc transport system ATP-binding protein